jgi:cytochrome c oxidase cbb3-type subunit 3
MLPWRACSFAIALALVGCGKTPDDLREWKTSDHDHTQEPGSGQVPANQPSSGGMFGISEVALAAWKQNCTTCHGIIGRGDGPQGPMTKARDLTDPAWQASVSDADIASSIKNGRGAMPAFPLPDSTIEGLVKLTRLLDRSRPVREADAGASDGGSGDAASDAAAPKQKPGKRDAGVRSLDAGR